MDDFSGHSIGKYQLIEKVGEGGMGVVYKALDTNLNRYVAVKLLRKEIFSQEQQVEIHKRFRREAIALARLSHTNILKVIDYGDYKGFPYLVTEFLSGGTLKDRLGNAMPWEDARRILIPVIEALGYAHSEGFVHRDVKPENILFNSSGQPIIADFGIAKILEPEGTFTELTGTQVGMGTPAYMAPEQGLGKPADARTDIYAVGVILFELVTGRQPFQADTPLAVMIKHVNDPLPRPRSINPKIPEHIENVLLKALAKTPQGRFQTIEDFIQALKNPPQKPKIQWWVCLTGGTPAFCLLLAILAAGVGFIFKGDPTSTPTIEPSIVPGLSHLPTKTATPTATEAPTSTPIGVFTQTPVPSSTPTSSKIQTQEYTNPIDGGIWVYIPEGAFIYGLDSDDVKVISLICPDCDKEINGSRPSHIVELRSYWIDKFEVSNARYKLCVDAGNCQEPKLKSVDMISNYYGNPEYDEYPVVYVSWDYANKFCRWAGGRLPTDAEWEKAARGTQGNLFPWGDDLLVEQDLLAYKLSPVNSYPAGSSPYGVINMAGNVWEWTADWWSDNYLQTNTDWINPTGPSEPGSPPRRVGRGGAWYHPLGFASAALRDWWEPEKSARGVGFRCAYDR